MKHLVVIVGCGLVGAFVAGRHVGDWLLASDGMAFLTGVLTAAAWVVYVLWILMTDVD